MGLGSIWMRAFARKLQLGVSTSLELVTGLWRGRYWWLVPVLIILLPLALVFVLLKTYPIVAPFVYTTF
jgi:hypothetical protein